MTGLTFLYPWLLAGLAALPALWILLRVTPPRPQTVRFPAFFLLKGLLPRHKAAAQTPWWLLLLRCLLAAVLVVALAEPVVRLHHDIPGGRAPVLVVIDNGWAAAANWPRRLERVRDDLRVLARAERDVVLLTTAPAADSGRVAASSLMTAAEALPYLESLLPVAWPADLVAAKAAAEAVLTERAIGYSLFFSDGTSQSALDMQDFLRLLQQRGGGVTVFDDAEMNDAVLLRPLDEAPGKTAFSIERPHPPAADRAYVLVATSPSGALVDERRVTVPGGARNHRVDWPLDDGQRAEISRITLAGPVTAGSVHLPDRLWRQRPVGIVADPGQRDNASLLNEIYYLRRALEAETTLVVDTVPNLLDEDRAVIFWPDRAPVTPADRVRLLDWVENGGLLVRFAGPSLAAQPDDILLPVRLLQGQRALEGAMTWEKPAQLGAIEEGSPFFGLAPPDEIPDDINVTRQVLAAPEGDTFDRTWLRLSDGTPLVTGAARGRGTIVLVHTTAGPDWSTLSYSGFYVEMLRRMVSLSRGIAGYRGSMTLPPLQVMTADGHLRPPAPGDIAGAVDTDRPFVPSARTPPGLYGDAAAAQPFPLGQFLGPVHGLPSLPAGVSSRAYAGGGAESHKPFLLKAAILLLLLDSLATMALRGMLTLPRRGAAVVVALCLVCQAPSAWAEQTAFPTAADRASRIYLAYVETGDEAVDETSRRGLVALSRVVSARTSIQVKGVVSVDPEMDDVFTCPFLYWPMTATQRPLSLTAAARVQAYMQRGGLVVFDTRDGRFGGVSGGLGQRRLQALTQNLALPPLEPVPQGHILRKTYYLLESFPGAFADGDVWVEKDPNPAYDGITSVLIGGHDWASAWAGHPATPGGARQSEMANRFGINLLMMALTGNYKSDQVHVPFILERMGE